MIEGQLELPSLDLTLQDGQDFILPADRCVWRQISVDGGYQIQATSVIVGGDSPANSDVRLDAAEGDIVNTRFPW